MTAGAYISVLKLWMPLHVILWKRLRKICFCSTKLFWYRIPFLSLLMRFHPKTQATIPSFAKALNALQDSVYTWANTATIDGAVANQGEHGRILNHRYK